MRLCLIAALVSIFILSGCIDFFPMEKYVMYSSSPTIVEYNISYGYRIQSRGGTYTLQYACPLPSEPLIGSIIEVLPLSFHKYTEIKVGENKFIEWEVNGSGVGDLEVGVTARLVAHSFVVDLNEEKGVQIEDIPKYLINQYCRSESTESSEKTLIDPKNPEIASLALLIKGKDNNSFSVAKKIFKWLKKNVRYETHEHETNPQAAIDTLHLRAGDCDDLSFLYISLCRAVNIPARFIRGYIVDLSGGEVEAIPHAWAEVYVGFGKDGWIPVECSGTSKDVQSEIYQNFGVEDAHHIRLFVDNGSNSSLEMSNKGPLLWYSGKVDLKSFVRVNDYREISHGSLTVYSDGRRKYTK